MTAPAEDSRGGEVWTCKRGYGESEHWVDGYYSCPGFRPPAAGRGDTDSDAIRAGVRALTGFTDREIDELGGIGGEHSTDLTPGVVWTDAQLAVVRDLLARAVRAEAAVSRVEALCAAAVEESAPAYGPMWVDDVRRALGGTT